MKSLEYTSKLPSKLSEDSAPSLQFPFERTQAIREAKELLGHDPKSLGWLWQGSQGSLSIIAFLESQGSLLR